ncbi:hypothetical protein JCGZ_01314 [Jatropha curcas]|uniref:Uncharacterized protein n=1 Tax=Jatropha curcas TaxID=180498 RepID=A0A067LKG8_JATCU|nr:uncharacterized protein LOC105646518 [Jatropha curcas]XP_020539977.1 uncharacterized protein LOC105646518 [Jatropha curcas]KDP44814.1 hypothetical protein JCGZ_01314 [Jatropha curcas]
MGLESLQSLQNLHLLIPHPPPSCRKPLCARSYSLSSFRSLNNHSLGYSLGYRSPLFGSCSNLRTFGLKRSCSADSSDFFDDDDDFARHVEDLKRKFDATEDRDDHKNDDNNKNDRSGSLSSPAKKISKNLKCDDGKKKSNKEKNDLFLPSKLEFLEPNLLGIRPEPPEWPERDEIVKMSIARKANSVDQIPLSLRMIGKKQKWQEGFVDAGDFAYCSVKKAFSSMVFMIRELQNYALSIRGRVYSEDLQAVVNKFQKEMNASFVWLFQQVFSRTPNLMVYVMLLLANFTVHSMAGSMETVSYKKLYHLPITTQQVIQEQISDGEKLSTSIKNPNFGLDDTTGMSSLSENQEMTEEEEIELWNLIVEEALKLQEESRYPVLDQETMKQLVSPISVEIEPEDYMEFHRTDLIYQMGVAEDPENPLLLSNYAQFLYMVRRDYDRAEECFKRAIMSGPPDAEIFSQYADFLWVVRNDLWNAEEVYQQALAAAPNSHYYASKYANFLWSTGGEETCFPLTSASYNTVM